jgi:hypothetical protein
MEAHRNAFVTNGLLMQSMKTRFALKAAIDDVHRELDDRLSRLNLSDPAEYALFLKIQARAVPR